MSGISTLSSVIKQAIDNKLKDVHTSTPGIIESFDPETQTASIQPAIKRIFVTTEEDKEILVPSDLPLLINVPVIFPRGGGFSLTFPVKKGDECHIQFCERSIDIWHQSGKISKPGARRFHNLSDAVAYVGLSSIPNKIPNYDPDNVVIKKDDDSVFIKLTSESKLEIYSKSDMSASVDGSVTATIEGSISVTANGDTSLKSPNITLDGNTSITGNLSVTGNTSLSSNVTSGGTNIGQLHTHSGPATAPVGPISPTGTPI